MSTPRAFAFASFTLAFAATAFAHHGAGSFELNKTVSFSNAKLTKMEFVNPHSWLYFEVPESNGVVSKHRCEMRSAHVLRRSGWSPELFKIGERIDITASPDRADPASCYLQTIMFANGTRMDRYGQYVKASEGGIKEVRGPLKEVNVSRPLRRPSGEPNISGDWAPEQLVMADPRGVGGGLVRLGTIGSATPGQRAGGGAGRRGAPPGPRLYGGTELTEAGEKAAAAFTQQDNPRFRCETTSIVFDWTFDGPVNRITQNKDTTRHRNNEPCRVVSQTRCHDGVTNAPNDTSKRVSDTIVLEYGQRNLKRTIYMNQKEHPAVARPTRAGHSIGRWDGDTLVVDTVAVLPGVLNAPVRNSDKLHVVERFTLDPKTMKLTRKYEAEDPVYLKGKYTGEDEIQPADAPYAEDKCKEQGFIDYSKQTTKK
jgi:hypothetical protein